MVFHQKNHPHRCLTEGAMSLMHLLSWIAVFAAISLLVSGIIRSVENLQSMKKRVKGVLHQGQTTEAGTTSPLKETLFSWLSSSGKWALKDEKEVSKVHQLLVQAGFRQPAAPAILYGIRAVVGFLLPIPLILFLVTKGKVNVTTVTLAFMMAGIGYFIPQLILERVARNRQDRIDKALPDVLDLFTICLEAGLGLNSAINRVADEIRAVCYDFYIELQLTAGEMRAGLGRNQALRNLAQRTGVQSVRVLTSLIIQSDKLGTSIAQSLRVHADSSRVQRSLRAEEKAGKMPVKILLPMVLFIFPVIFVVAVGPGVIQIMKNLLPKMAGH
jgi:tight adherence protein C